MSGDCGDGVEVVGGRGEGGLLQGGIDGIRVWRGEGGGGGAMRQQTSNSFSACPKLDNIVFERKDENRKVATLRAQESPMMEGLFAGFFTSSSEDVKVRIRHFISPSS